jgi:hypothetical protein
MSNDPADFDQRLTGALAAIEKARRKGLLWLAGLFGAVVSVISILHLLGLEDVSLFFFLIGTVFLAPLIFGWTRKTHTDVVMPLLAEQLGLDYSKPGSAIAPLIAPWVLPDQDVSSDAIVHGKLAGRDVWMADVVVKERSGDNDIIFKGFVLSVDKFSPGTDLFINDKKYARVWPSPQGAWQRGPDIATAHRRAYTVWSKPDHSLPDEATLAELIGLERMFGAGSRLAALRCSDGRLTMAVRQSDVFFEIGGLLRTPARIRADMATALSRLSLPLQIATALLELAPRLKGPTTATPEIPSPER